MPVLIGFLIVSVIAGLALSPRAARSVTATAALIALVALVWAVADGKGNDPAWLIAVAVAGVAIGAAVCEALVRHRHLVRRPQ